MLDYSRLMRAHVVDGRGWGCGCGTVLQNFEVLRRYDVTND
jgi:hypothetical protein